MRPILIQLQTRSPRRVGRHWVSVELIQPFDNALLNGILTRQLVPIPITSEKG
ncbi:hypothetical protein HMPREF1979_02944, partial [Actinomyces johnsonii F0542]